MKVIKNIIFVAIVFLISIGLLVVGNGYDMYKDAISKIPLTEKVETIKEKENYTKIEEVPEIYIKAVISVEDHRFYKHNGIDIIAIGRATINDIKAMSFVEGGSTITQQLSKNIYFTQEKKITRKIAEVFMSFEIEKNYNKDEILELYLNTSYFGEGCYTVKEASRKYFGKEPKKMTDYEAIMLAGIPNAPSVYSLTKNPELAKEFLRFLYSDESVSAFAEASGALYATKSAREVAKDKLSTAIYNMYGIYEEANASSLIMSFAAVPADCKVNPKDEIFNPITSVMNDEMTVEEWAQNVEDAFAQVRADMEAAN